MNLNDSCRTDEWGSNALMLAAERGDGEAVARLASRFDIDASNDDGATALMFAAGRSSGGGSAALKALLDAGADVHLTDRGQRDALMAAAASGCPGRIELLLRHGADPLAFDKHGQTALMWAALALDPRGLELLIDVSDIARRGMLGTAADMAAAAKMWDSHSLIRARLAAKERSEIAGHIGGEISGGGRADREGRL